MTEVSLEAMLRRMSRLAEELSDEHGEVPMLCWSRVRTRTRVKGARQ
jgi:hypothetical protein